MRRVFVDGHELFYVLECDQPRGRVLTLYSGRNPETWTHCIEPLPPSPAVDWTSLAVYPHVRAVPTTTFFGTVEVVHGR